ncbi:hypothetical protein jhhlp_004742 [Lomentospora prolificans]|uniref:Nitrate reductase [NADPH] n=1 Tax=Lomentospora prolificans TaxID=41688 RepID=A0A2N3N8B1_9PEZI|nr:hypothetical protein jhhlp_004742 [Lomentospora prolificans]
MKVVQNRAFALLSRATDLSARSAGSQRGRGCWSSIQKNHISNPRPFTCSSRQLSTNDLASPIPPPRKPGQKSRARIPLLASGCIFATVVAYTYFSGPLRADAAFAHHSLGISADSDGRDPSLPRYRISEVRKHGPNSDRPWVTYGDKVYDITDWIPAHPGGDVILRAAGGSIDLFWDIFAIHKQPYVRDILETYLIGYVDSADLVNGKLPQDKIEDPFLHDPERHPALLTLTLKPRNAETPGETLADSFLTPNDLFYVRNHMWVPRIDGTGDEHALTIELPDGDTKSYTLKELREKFPAYKVTATLQCSGNRRKHMTGAGLKTNGLQWNVGGISSAEWEGVRLVDVLKDAGFPVDKHRDGADTGAKHVWFSGLEAYGASIPLDTAVDPRADVLLAYGMNGQPLPRDHGFPLRALVPGTVAARSVKWLSKIVLSDEESPSQWQRRDYKLFGPNVGAAADWDSAPAIQEMPINSAITSIKVQNDGPTDCLDPNSPEKIATLQGYAFSGGGRRIIRVDVSLDNGKTWDQAELIDDCEPREGEPSPCKGRKHWVWQRWRYDTQLPMNEQHGDKRCSTVVVKATDEGYNSQPERHEGIYNLRGNLATAWHRVSVCTECRKG